MLIPWLKHWSSHTLLIRRAESGGAISVDNTGSIGLSYVAIHNSALINNSAVGLPAPATTFAELPGTGGALRAFAGGVWIEGSTIQGNNAQSAGGGVFFSHTCLVCAMYLLLHAHMCTYMMKFDPEINTTS